jgi:hypothetical protein
MEGFIATIGILLVGFFCCLGFISLLEPDEDDVIIQLVELGAVNSYVERGEVVNVLVDEKFRPLLKLWEGKGLSFYGEGGNIISH